MKIAMNNSNNSSNSSNSNSNSSQKQIIAIAKAIAVSLSFFSVLFSLAGVQSIVLVLNTFDFHNSFSIEKKVKSTIFSIILFFQECEEEKEKMKMKKINFFIIEVTWANVISLDSPIIAHVESANGFPPR